jgi:hypothetical protein
MSKKTTLVVSILSLVMVVFILSASGVFALMEAGNGSSDFSVTEADGMKRSDLELSVNFKDVSLSLKEGDVIPSSFETITLVYSNNSEYRILLRL